MTDGPLVSIVINSYNQAAYLEQTICSVLEQDYPNMEVLLVDGGSTDGSLEIIDRYKNRFSWWVSEKDSGQAEGINKGLIRGRGDLVAWLNSDDYYLPGALTKAVRVWQKYPQAVLIYGDVFAVDEHGKTLNRMLTGDLQLTDLMEFHILNQPGVFMSRKALKLSGFLDMDYHYLLDHKLWLGIAVQGEVVHARQIWAAGRFHPEAKNIAAAVHFGQEAYRILEWMQNTPPYCQLGSGRWNRMEAGAHRINARYLLDGGRPLDALKAYWCGYKAYPGAVLPEWHRVVYGLICLVGLGGIKRWFYRLRALVRPVRMD